MIAFVSMDVVKVRQGEYNIECNEEELALIREALAINSRTRKVECAPLIGEIDDAGRE